MSYERSNSASSNDKSSETIGKLLMIFVAIIGASTLVIGYWAALTGGGFN
jgi:hypothetical protein